MTPTSRALADLRKQGHTAAITERWNPHAKIRQDLFGFCDILYLTGASIVALQVTSGTNHAARRAKILAEPRALKWLKSGGVIELWSYSKAGARGKRKLWTVRREEIGMADFYLEGVLPQRKGA